MRFNGWESDEGDSTNLLEDLVFVVLWHDEWCVCYIINRCSEGSIIAVKKLCVSIGGGELQLGAGSGHGKAGK